MQNAGHSVVQNAERSEVQDIVQNAGRIQVQSTVWSA